MKTMPLRGAIAASIVALSPIVVADAIDYPDGYRLWAHVKSLTLHDGHPLANPFKGIHHIYANDRALRGLKAEHYPDGSMFVFDLLESQTANNASSEGKRILTAVMVKDSARFPATDGWGYEGWAGDSRTERLVNDDGQSCHGCHMQQKEKDFVFSQWRD